MITALDLRYHLDVLTADLDGREAAMWLHGRGGTVIQVKPGENDDLVLCDLGTAG